MMRLKTPKSRPRNLTDNPPAQLSPEAIDGCQEELFENPVIRRNRTRRLQTASSFHADGPFCSRSFITPPSQRRAEKGSSECRVPGCGELNQEMKRNFVWYWRT